MLSPKLLLSMFSTPVNNRVYKITYFQLRGGLTNKNTRIYPGSGRGNSPTFSGLILIKTCVIMGEQNARLVYV
jgi:hypothetical protein